MMRSNQAKGGILLSPAIVMLTLLFVVPIVMFMWRAVSNVDVMSSIPRTAQALRAWDGAELPGDDVVRALAADANVLAGDTLRLGRFARRMNYHVPGARTTIMKTVRELEHTGEPATLQRLVSIDRAWGERPLWTNLRQQSSSMFTSTFLLATIDLTRDESGHIVQVNPENALHLKVLGRTIAISLAVTTIVLLLAYPAAYTLAHASRRLATGLMLVLLASFWISLLVKTLAWIVIFQKQGILNQLLLSMGGADAPLELLYTRSAVIVAMAHLLLPFMILPIYSSMKRIPPNLCRASLSLGAGPLRTFLRVYLPMSISGVTGGCMLVSVLALGFYITPQLLGGRQDQMTSYFVAFHTNKDVNWGLASALGFWLLLLALVFSLALMAISRIIQPSRAPSRAVS